MHNGLFSLYPFVFEPIKTILGGGMGARHFFMGAIDAADVMGWADQIGAIEPGKFADMIAVDESPLADIKQLEHVRFVMKRRGCCAQQPRQIDGREG